MEQEKPRDVTGSGFEPSGPSTNREQPHRLYRSRKDRVVAGVCGGLGHYFNLDPTLVRIGFVALAFAGGAGILVYILASLVLPEANEDEDFVRPDVDGLGQGRIIFGGLLVVVGAILLLREVVPWFNGEVIWATILIALGLGVMFRGSMR